MLWNREDAEDATQEILVRVVTRLSQFDSRSRLKTWVYRVAVNYILDVKKSATERLHLSFEQFAEDLAEGVQPAAPDDTEQSLLIEEVKVACTLAMLQCLDRPHRLAYVLGEIMDFSGPEAADALGISPALFRKRLEHARREIVEFARSHCGWCQTRPPASATAVSCLTPWRTQAGGGRSSSQAVPRPSSRLAPWCARSTRRAGRWRSIARAIRGLRPSTSLTA